MRQGLEAERESFRLGRRRTEGERERGILNEPGEGVVDVFEGLEGLLAGEENPEERVERGLLIRVRAPGGERGANDRGGVLLHPASPVNPLE